MLATYLEIKRCYLLKSANKVLGGKRVFSRMNFPMDVAVDRRCFNDIYGENAEHLVATSDLHKCR